MFIKFLIKLNQKVKSSSISKLKIFILDELYSTKVSHNTDIFYCDTFSSDKIMQYRIFDNNIFYQAIKELSNEKKITINEEDNNFPLSISLTENTFKELSNNKTPFKIWLKSNIFNIISSVIGLWGAITGTLALFFK